MSYLVRLRLSAERDVERAEAHYDEVAPEQTDRFAAELLAGLHMLEDSPGIGRPLRWGARRYSLRAFPYQLWYRVYDDAEYVEVLAGLNHSLDLDRFSSRLV